MSGLDDNIRNADEIERRYRELYPLVTGTKKPTPKDEGFVKPGGWGGNTRKPKEWKVVSMKDDPKLFKVVDKKRKNIAANFFTKAGAQAFIDKAIELSQEDGEPDEPDNTPEVPPVIEEPEIPKPPTGGTTTPGQLGPYPAIGKTFTSTRRPESGFTTRHYASGKEDDKTVEQNVKNIKARAHQFITYVTMKSIEHSDNISLKLGGTHNGSGWFDNGVDFESGQTCLGTEKKHPSTDTCVIKGPKIGSVLNKKVGVAATYFADKNKTELWTDTGTGWKKQVEGTNVGGFNPKSDTFECQLRIDGFEDLPDIHTSVVQEIAPQ